MIYISFKTRKLWPKNGGQISLGPHDIQKINFFYLARARNETWVNAIFDGVVLARNDSTNKASDRTLFSLVEILQIFFRLLNGNEWNLL